MGIIPQHRRAVAGARPLCHRVRKRNDHRRAESGGQGWPVFTGTITAGGSFHGTGEAVASRRARESCLLRYGTLGIPFGSQCPARYGSPITRITPMMLLSSREGPPPKGWSSVVSGAPGSPV